MAMHEGDYLFNLATELGEIRIDHDMFLSVIIGAESKAPNQDRICYVDYDTVRIVIETFSPDGVQRILRAFRECTCQERKTLMMWAKNSDLISPQRRGGGER